MTTHLIRVFSVGKPIGYLVDSATMLTSHERSATHFRNNPHHAELFMKLAKELQNRDGRSYKFDVQTISTVPKIKNVPHTAFAFLPRESS